MLTKNWFKFNNEATKNMIMLQMSICQSKTINENAYTEVKKGEGKTMQLSPLVMFWIDEVKKRGRDFHITAVYKNITESWLGPAISLPKPVTSQQRLFFGRREVMELSIPPQISIKRLEYILQQPRYIVKCFRDITLEASRNIEISVEKSI